MVNPIHCQYEVFVHQATGARLAMVVQTVASLGAGLGIGFYYSWKLALLVAAFVPFIVFANSIAFRRLGGGKKLGKKNPLEESGKVISFASVSTQKYLHSNCLVNRWQLRPFPTSEQLHH